MIRMVATPDEKQMPGCRRKISPPLLFLPRLPHVPVFVPPRNIFNSLTLCSFFIVRIISSLRMAFITESLLCSWSEKDWLNDFSADNTSLCRWFTHYPLRLLTECFDPHRGCCSLRVALLTQADLPFRVEHFQDGAEHGQTSSHRTWGQKFRFLSATMERKELSIFGSNPLFT